MSQRADPTSREAKLVADLDEQHRYHLSFVAAFCVPCVPSVPLGPRPLPDA